MQTHKQYLKTRAQGLRQDYPDSTRQERREVLKGATTEWLRQIAALERAAIVPLEVGRSLVALLGHNEASRMLRHVANYPECLPANRKVAVENWINGVR